MGCPTAESPVLVTANYKLTLDHLRSKLDGTDAWIPVLDTKGVNVWCAAGKGTFGTDEIVRQVAATRLAEVVGTGMLSAILLLISWLASAVLAPALLPWLPGRPLSLKGLWGGLALLGLLAGVVCGMWGRFDSWLGMASWSLLVPAVSSYMVLVYTGSTTYTSLSGVRYEMRRAVPAQVVAALAGLVVWIVGRFI